MGQYRLSARMMNDINSLFYCTPLWRNVTGFTAREIFFKYIGKVTGFTGLNQEAREMAPRYGSAVGETLCAFQRTGDQRFFKSFTDQYSTLVTTFFLL